jgi:prepilin-type N-terminal cleavage/methylation domain-containing protein
MMRYISSHCRHQNGFTLIEIIVTLILIGMTAAIMFPVMGNNLMKSPEPITRVNTQYALIQEMDKWNGLYRNAIEKDTLDLSSFKLDIDNNANYLDNTTYINSFNGGAYTTQGTDKILMVTLKKDNQTVCSLFSDQAP